MRLAKLQNFKFSDLNFYHYFFTAYIGLHVTFSVLLGNITAFAPDELRYVKIFTLLYTDGFTSDVAGFGDVWTPWLRVIYFPAKILTLVGFSNVYAIRFLSIGFATLATYFIVKLAHINNRDSSSFRIALILISFVPSVFLWSSIGLRESLLYVEIAAILFFLSRLNEKPEIRSVLGFGISIFSLAITKNYVFVLFLFAIGMTILIFGVLKRGNRLTLIAILFLTAFPLTVNQSLVPAITTYFSGQLAKPESSVIGDVNNDGRCDDFEFCKETKDKSESNEIEPKFVTTGGFTVHALLVELKKHPNSVVSKISEGIGITNRLEAIANEKIFSEFDDRVVKNVEALSLQQAGLKHPGQIVRASLNFLFAPVIFKDNGSLFLNIQSVETPIWLFLYGILIIGLYMILRLRRNLDYASLVATLFIFEFIIVSALTEVNVGTAVRHRSLILIPILVIWLARKKEPL